MKRYKRNQKTGEKTRTRKGRLEAEKRRASYTAFAIIAVIVVVVGAGAAVFISSLFTTGGNSGGAITSSGFDPVTSCTGNQPLVMHIHVRLFIVINGFQQQIPANVGNSPSCMHVIHTHDTSGEIHVESPVKYDFQLTHFFQIWGQPFSRDNVLGNFVDAEHFINFTVNNEPTLEYENLVLRDGQRVVIEYTRRQSNNLLLDPHPIAGFPVRTLIAPNVAEPRLALSQSMFASFGSRVQR